MKRKINFKNKIVKNTLLLISPDIENRNNIYILKSRKSKKVFTLPALFIKYINSNNISVKVMINYNNGFKLKKYEILTIACDACRIIDDFGFQFYLKQNGEDINLEDLGNLTLHLD